MSNESDNGGSAKLNESIANQTDSKSPQKPTEKDRTLFCIKIDSKCTEEILYELFLQAGPIDNLIRKTDRNGSLICLVTYKHIESCEYAIQLFNGLQLFGQSIRVQFSQNSQNIGLKSSMSFNSPAGSNTPNGGMKRTTSSTPAMDRALPPPVMSQFDPSDPNVQQMINMMPFVNQLGSLLAAPQPQDQYNRSRSSHGGRGGEHHSRRGEYYDNRAGGNNNQYNKNHHQSHSSWQPPVSRDANFNNNSRHSRHQTFNQPNRFNNNNNNNNNNPMVQNNFNNFNPNFNNNSNNNRQRSRSRSPSNKRHKRF